MTIRRLKPITLYTDASVLHNGKHRFQDSYCAVVVDNGTYLGKLVRYVHLGSYSVNESEYYGIIEALRWILYNDIEYPCVIITDSQLAYKQVYGFTPCFNDPLYSLRNHTVELLEKTGAKLMWKSRKRNLAGWFFQNLVKQRRKDKYRVRKEKKRGKRKLVRQWTIDNPEISGYGGRGRQEILDQASEVRLPNKRVQTPNHPKRPAVSYMPQRVRDGMI